MNCIILQLKLINKCKKVRILQKIMRIIKLTKKILIQLGLQGTKIFLKKEDHYYIKMHNNH